MFTVAAISSQCQSFGIQIIKDGRKPFVYSARGHLPKKSLCTYTCVKHNHCKRIVFSHFYGRHLRLWQDFSKVQCKKEPSHQPNKSDLESSGPLWMKLAMSVIVLLFFIWFGYMRLKKFVAHHSPVLIKHLSTQLGREVDVGKVQVSLLPPSIILRSCSIGPHSQEFSCAEIPTLKISASLLSLLLSLLLERKLVFHVTLSHPSVLVVQKEDDSWLGMRISEGSLARLLSTEKGIDCRTKIRRATKEQDALCKARKRYVDAREAARISSTSKKGLLKRSAIAAFAHFSGLSNSLFDDTTNVSNLEVPSFKATLDLEGGKLMILAFGDRAPREMENVNGHMKFQNHIGCVHVKLSGSGNCKMRRSDVTSVDGGSFSVDAVFDSLEQKLDANLKVANLFVPLLERILEIPIIWSKGRADGEVRLCLSRGETIPNLYGQVDVKGLAFQILDAPSSFSNLSARLCFHGQQIFIHNGSGWFGEVSLEASGEFGIHPKGVFNLKCKVPCVEVNALMRTLKMKPLLFPLAGSVNAEFNLEGPLDAPIFVGSGMVLRDIAHLASIFPASPAYEAITKNKEAGVVAAFDRVPLSYLSTNFTFNTDNCVTDLYGIRASLVGGGEIQGSGNVWTCPEGEMDDTAIDMSFFGNLSLDEIMHHYLPGYLDLVPFKFRDINGEAKLSGSLLRPRFGINWAAPNAEGPFGDGRGDIIITDDSISVTFSSVAFELHTKIHTSTDDRGVKSSKPLIVEGVEFDFLSLVSPCHFDSPRPVHLKETGTIKFQGKFIRPSGITNEEFGSEQNMHEVQMADKENMQCLVGDVLISGLKLNQFMVAPQLVGVISISSECIKAEFDFNGKERDSANSFEHGLPLKILIQKNNVTSYADGTLVVPETSSHFSVQNFPVSLFHTVVQVIESSAANAMHSMWQSLEPLEGLLHMEGDFRGTLVKPEFDVVVRLLDGAIGGIDVRLAEIVASLTPSNCFLFSAQLEPMVKKGHVHIQGSIPAIFGQNNMSGAENMTTERNESSERKVFRERKEGWETHSAESLNDLHGKILDAGEFKVYADIKNGGISLLTVLFPYADWLHGNAHIVLQVSGTVEEPVLDGSASFQMASISSPVLREPLTSFGGTVHVKSNRLCISSLEGSVSKRGKLFVEGNLPLRTSEALSSDKIDFKCEIMEVQAKNILSGQVDAQMQITGSILNPIISGMIKLSNIDAYLLPRFSSGNANPENVLSCYSKYFSKEVFASANKFHQPSGPLADLKMVRINNSGNLLLSHGEAYIPHDKKSGTDALEKLALTQEGFRSDGVYQAVDPRYFSHISSLVHFASRNKIHQPSGVDKKMEQLNRMPKLDINLNNLKLVLGPEIRIVSLFGYVAVIGELELNGVADPQMIKPNGIIRFEHGDVNLFATQAKLMKEHLNIARFKPKYGLDPCLDIVLVGLDKRCRIQGRASLWKYCSLVVTSMYSVAEDDLSTFEWIMSMPEGDVQKLGSAVLNYFMPRIEGTGNYGQPRGRLLLTPHVPTSISFDDLSQFLKSTSLTAEAEIKFLKYHKASITREIKEVDERIKSETQLTWASQLKSHTRLLLGFNWSRSLFFWSLLLDLD